MQKPNHSLGSSRDRIFDAVREDILLGRFKPGERLRETRLAQLYNTSRSPIREAFQRLASQGLIKLIPRKGAFVKTYEINEIRDLFEAREAIDGMAARAAASRIDSMDIQRLVDTLSLTESMLKAHTEISYPLDIDFHHKILEAAKNAKILAIGWEIHSQLRIVRGMSGHSPDRARSAYEEHCEILNAIKNHDSDNAEKIMRDHIKNALKNVTFLVEKGGINL